jgi:hypothetical protein
VVDVWAAVTVKLGAMLVSSNMSRTPESRSASPEKADTATGTSCRFCSRFWAVTTTSSSALCRDDIWKTRAEGEAKHQGNGMAQPVGHRQGLITMPSEVARYKRKPVTSSMAEIY